MLAPMCMCICMCAPCTVPQLCDIASLRGATGVTRYVLGAISAGEGGGLVLEDEGASVPLDVSEADTAAGFYTGKAQCPRARMHGPHAHGHTPWQWRGLHCTCMRGAHTDTHACPLGALRCAS